MNDTTMQMTTQMHSGLGTPAGGHDLGAIAGRVALSGITGATVLATGTDVVRDRQGSVALASTCKAFPGSLAWRPPIT